MSVSGTLRFGLTHPIVDQMVRELPGADKYEEVAAMSLLSNGKNLFADFSDSESSDEFESVKSYKRPKRSHDAFSARDVVFSTREEIDALESAVATLYALKFGTL